VLPSIGGFLVNVVLGGHLSHGEAGTELAVSLWTKIWVVNSPLLSDAPSIVTDDANKEKSLSSPK
jgi:hypothetical protein